MVGNPTADQLNNLKNDITQWAAKAKRVILVDSDGTVGSDTILHILAHSTDPNITYMCWAERGSATSAAVWKIKRIDDTSGSIFLLAGDGQFSQILDNMESLSYS